MQISLNATLLEMSDYEDGKLPPEIQAIEILQVALADYAAKYPERNLQTIVHMEGREDIYLELAWDGGELKGYAGTDTDEDDD